MANFLKISCLVLFLFACGEKKEDQVQTPETPVVEEPIKIPEVTPPSKPTVNLIKSSFAELENWNNDKHILTLAGFKLSCQKILLEKNAYLSNSAVKIPTKAYQEICKRLLHSSIKNSAEFKFFIEENFNPYKVTDNGNEVGKFTSYYESALNGSFKKQGNYKYPIYGKPFDLIEFNPKDFDDTAPSKRYVGRLKNNKVIPYYTRAEIETGSINAPVVMWADSHIDIYVMQIQGSAVATLEDGSEVRIGYADNNGLPFKGIGSILLEKGLIKPGQASMGQIKRWLVANQQIAEEHLFENKRYIFHRIINADGPIGAQGVPLHAGRSIAVDRSYIPLGSLIWLETTGPDKEDIHHLVVAQDIGSAIKGIVRGDYFWGSGKDDVLEKAGKMNSQGRYFVLVPKNVEIQ